MRLACHFASYRCLPLTLSCSLRLRVKRSRIAAIPMNSFFQDLRYAFRRLRMTPGFTAVAIATLALGIGANSAIFTVINAVLLRALPFRDPGKIVLLSESIPQFPI